MKKIPKRELDMLIEVTKKYWSCTNRVTEEDALYKKHKISMLIQKRSDINWVSINDFIGSIFQYKGINPNATNDEIYCTLRQLGWEVSDGT